MSRTITPFNFRRELRKKIIKEVENNMREAARTAQQIAKIPRSSQAKAFLDGVEQGATPAAMNFMVMA